MTSNQALAATIRGIRQSRGLSQEDFNSIDRSYVGRLERGEVKVSVEVLQRIASILDVEAGMLLLITSALTAGNSARDILRIADKQLEELERHGALSLIANIVSSVQSPSAQSREVLAAERLEKIRAMRQIGMSMEEIAKSLNLSKSTVHAYLKKTQ